MTHLVTTLAIALVIFPQVAECEKAVEGHGVGRSPMNFSSRQQRVGFLHAGGVSVFPIMTLPSGERYGGVKDPCGNVWWVATHVEDVSPAEEERRWKAFKMP
jgi:hypothetical protein